MADAILTQARLKEILHYDPETGVFTWKVKKAIAVRIGDIAGCSHRVRGYIDIHIDGVLYKAHRLVWLYVYGVWPKNQIDHINGIRTDNRFLNLREATNSENQQNLKKPSKANTSGFIGVSFSKAANKWKATICLNRKNIHLGVFDTPELAHDEYLKAKQLLHTHSTQ